MTNRLKIPGEMRSAALVAIHRNREPMVCAAAINNSSRSRCIFDG
jgi:hypothetical protein